MDGKRWARLTLWVGIIMSMYGNIQHTFIIQKQIHWGAILFAAFWPGAVFLAIELMAKVDWPNGWTWSVARFGGLGIVALVAAIASYHHLAALLAYWGEDTTVAALGPLVPDGIMVLATAALLAIGGAERPVEALEDVPEGEGMPEPATDSSEALDAAELADELDGLDVPDERQSGNGHQGRKSDHQAAARRAYLRSLDRGKPLNGEQLGDRYGMSPRWGRLRIAEARQTRQELDGQPA